MPSTTAVSGFYFAHPQSEYFGVARIGPDQVADYAARRGVDLKTAERWLRPNLDYGGEALDRTAVFDPIAAVACLRLGSSYETQRIF